MFVAALAVATVVLVIAAVEYWWPAPMEPGASGGPPVSSMAARDPAVVDDVSKRDSPITPPAPMRLPSADPRDNRTAPLVPAADRLLMLQPGDEPLVGEPAELDRPPGAEPVASFRRRAAGKVEEVAVRRIAGMTVEQAHAFYADAAIRRGFKSLAELAGGPSAGQPGATRSSRLYVRRSEGQRPDAAADQILTVRVTADDATAQPPKPPLAPGRSGGPGVRVLLWFQYPNAAATAPHDKNAARLEP